jgi:hypothetical protein
MIKAVTEVKTTDFHLRSLCGNVPMQRSGLMDEIFGYTEL